MDKNSHSKKELYATIDRALGGRIAEELIYGADEVSTGAYSDFNTATNVARNMVMHYGMSDTIGYINYTNEDYATLSTETKHKIEEETSRILKESYDRAKKLLKSKEKELHLLANALIEYETLSGEEAIKVIQGIPIEKKTV